MRQVNELDQSWLPSDKEEVAVVYANAGNKTDIDLSIRRGGSAQTCSFLIELLSETSGTLQMSDIAVSHNSLHTES